MTTTVETITPIGDRVFVKPDALPTRTPGGLYLPESAKTRPSLRGVIKAMGPGMPTAWGRWPNDGLKVGDHIIFADEATPQVTLDGEVYLVMREDNVLAIETFDEAQAAE